MSSTPPPDPTPTTPPSSSAASLGGYAVRNLREAGGEETARFEAVITRHGRPIAHVSNGGHGGSHRYDPVERGVKGTEDLADLSARAVLWNASNELAGYEDTDQFVDRLVTVAHLNRMRRPAFLLDGEDFWGTGRAHALGGGALSHDEAVRYLLARYPGRNVRLWNRNVSDWVPID